MARLSSRTSDTILSSYRAHLPFEPAFEPVALAVAAAVAARGHETAPGIAPQPGPERRRLWELSPMLHCSIIGTCLTAGELREILRRIARREGFAVATTIGPRSAQPRRSPRRAPRWTGQAAAQGAGPAACGGDRGFRIGQGRERRRSAVARRARAGRLPGGLLVGADAPLHRRAPGASSVRRGAHALASRGGIQSGRHSPPEGARGAQRPAPDGAVGAAARLAPCARGTRCPPAAPRGAAPAPCNVARRTGAAASARAGNASRGRSS